MPARIDVFLLPHMIHSNMELYDLAIAVDILRATTTMTQALFNGVAAIYPCLQVSQAEAKRDALRREIDEAWKSSGKSLQKVPKVLTGGERGGLKIPGFDLSNSPADYSVEVVRDNYLVFTTTNGTKAIHESREAGEIICGAFVNLKRVLDRVAQAQRVAIICAGTNGEVTREDSLFAGAIVSRFRDCEETNDPAELVRAAWEKDVGTEFTFDKLRDQLLLTRGGKNLTKLGLQSDVGLVAQVDSAPTLPFLDKETGRILAS